MSIPPSLSQSQLLSSFPRHRAAQIATAGSDVSGAPLFNKFSTMLPSVTAEQEALISNICTLALGVREIDSTFYVTLMSISQCLIRYSKEMQKLERKIREMQVMLDAFEAVKKLGNTFGGDAKGAQKEWRTEVVEVVVEGRREKEGKVVDFTVEKQETEGEAAGEQLVDLKEWPLPPSKSEWVMAQGEKRRKRQTK